MSTNLELELRAAFQVEARELLAEMDGALLALEESPKDIEIVHRIFRAIHTLKGSGGMVGLGRLAAFAHGVEEAFDMARDSRLAVTPQLIDCGLRACDVIRGLLGDQRSGTEPVDEAGVSLALRALLPAVAGIGMDLPRQGQPADGGDRAYEILLRPDHALFASGTDPVTLLDELRSLGPAQVRAWADRVPAISELDAEGCYLRWEILLVTSQGEAAVREVFEFVEDQCQIGIRLLDDQKSAVVLLRALPPALLEARLSQGEAHLAACTRLTAVPDTALPDTVPPDTALPDTVPPDTVPPDTAVLDTALDENGSGEQNRTALRTCLAGFAETARALAQPMGGALQGHPLAQVLALTEAFIARLASAQESDSETVRHWQAATEALGDAWQGVTGQQTILPLARELSSWLQLPAAAVQATPNDAQKLFDYTASQCVEMIGVCLHRMEGGATVLDSTLRAYIRSLKTLASAADYHAHAGVDEPAACQLTILERAVAGSVVSREDWLSLSQAFSALRNAVSPGADAGPLPAAPPASDAEPGVTPATGTSSPAATIRIDQEKLDRLMRVVGELLVARGSFPVLVQKLQQESAAALVAKELKEAGSAISRIAEELQACVMSIRMLPVKTVFQRFPRLVRDLARSLDKEVQFSVEGEGIELDKTILEQIGDPLVHLVRNAVDHGLEPVHERVAQGKPAAGQLLLRATSEAGAVVIEVIDDGRGLNAGALRRKAVERGLLTAEAAQELSEDAAFDLIFAPGLSTAEKVTGVSGRGVGMDVVRSNIRALQGSIGIQSRLGGGTAFSVRLPTSLMVSKGILLEAGGQEYLLPLAAIRDMVKLPASQIHGYAGGRMAHVRGRICPVYVLSELLALDGDNAQEELSIAIIEAGDQRYGLIVDRFVTELEVIVKPLPTGLEACRAFQGAAILGDGRIALVLNPAECHRVMPSSTLSATAG